MSPTDALPTVKLPTHGSARPYGELPWTSWKHGPDGEIFRQEYPRTSNFDPQTKENLTSSSETQLQLRNFHFLPHPTFHLRLFDLSTITPFNGTSFCLERQELLSSQRSPSLTFQFIGMANLALKQLPRPMF